MYASIPSASAFSYINPLPYSCMLWTYLWQSPPFWNKTSMPALPEKTEHDYSTNTWLLARHYPFPTMLCSGSEQLHKCKLSKNFARDITVYKYLVYNAEDTIQESWKTITTMHIFPNHKITVTSKTFILPVVLCRCDMWALPAWRKHELQPFENNVRSEVLTVMIIKKQCYTQKYCKLNLKTYMGLIRDKVM